MSDSLEGAVEEVVIEVNRQQLLRHLRRLGFAGEVELAGPLKCTAVSLDRDPALAVHTPGLECEPLPRALGVRLPPLIRMLNCLEGETIELGLEGDYLVLTSGQRRIRQRTIASDFIFTRLSERKLLELISNSEWQEFDSSVATVVAQAIRGLGVTKHPPLSGLVVLRVEPEGMTIIVGDRESYTVEFDVPEVQTEDSYTVLLPPQEVQDAFDEVGDSRLAIRLIGPDSVVGLQLMSQNGDVETIYVISPMKEVRGPRGALPVPLEKGVREGHENDLLNAVYKVLVASGQRHLPTEELISQLASEGFEFTTWKQPAGELAHRLDKYGLKPQMCGDTGLRGYYLKDLEIALGIDTDSDEPANPANDQ